MTKPICLIATWAMLTISIAPAFAQKEKLKEARLYMEGRVKPYNPDKAFQLFGESAGTGDPEAMNALGNMYNSGLGTAKNPVLAKEWYQKASNAGYAKASYNLGTLYRYSNGSKPDFEKAYTYFAKSATANDPEAWYQHGYMLYKGLGCEQNYDKAAELFIKGAEAGNGRCMHFLGLSYLNGYSVPQDMALAKKWLQKSANKGNEEAKKALALDGPEGVNAQYLEAISKEVEIPAGYEAIQHAVASNNIAGDYEGYLVTYDWSGSKIVQLLPLSVTLTADGDNITGEWNEGSDITSSLKAKLNSNGITFNSPAFKRRDNYNNKGLWSLENATLNIEVKDKVATLKGNLKMFSPETLESGKPMYITLARVATRQEVLSTLQTNVNLFPNPCYDKTTLTFSLASDASVELIIQSLYGDKVLHKELGKLTAGKHEIELSTPIPTGAYVVKINSGNNAVQTTTLLKH